MTITTRFHTGYLPDRYDIILDISRLAHDSSNEWECHMDNIGKDHENIRETGQFIAFYVSVYFVYHDTERTSWKNGKR